MEKRILLPSPGRLPRGTLHVLHIALYGMAAFAMVGGFVMFADKFYIGGAAAAAIAIVVAGWSYYRARVRPCRAAWRALSEALAKSGFKDEAIDKSHHALFRATKPSGRRWTRLMALPVDGGTIFAGTWLNDQLAHGVAIVWAVADELPWSYKSSAQLRASGEEDPTFFTLPHDLGGHINALVDFDFTIGGNIVVASLDSTEVLVEKPRGWHATEDIPGLAQTIVEIGEAIIRHQHPARIAPFNQGRIG